jgi:hypothetical protein
MRNLLWVSARRFSLSVALTALIGGAAIDGQVLSPNLLFTSIQPCRVFDTRAPGDPLLSGVQRAFTVVGHSSDFVAQGGHSGGCGIPGFLGGISQVQAVMINIVAVSPASIGDLRAWPSDQPEPLASILNYTPAEFALANGIVIPVRQDHEGGDITILSEGSGTHVLGDVVGYFSSGGPGMGNLSLGMGAGNQSISTGNLNTAFGDFALALNTTGAVNTALGYLALGLNTTGANNTAAGTFALNSNTIGNQNVAIGRGALGANSSGGGNTGLGYAALPFLNTGNNNVAIGFNAGISYTGGESNNILISNDGVAGESNVIKIGSSHTRAYIVGVSGSTVAGGTPVYIDGGGHLGTTPSSLRFKEDVTDMGDASDSLMQLRPVVFHYKSDFDDGSKILQYGLIAEEVAVVSPGLVQYDKDGQPLLVRYHFVNAMVLNEVQKQHRTIDEQKTRIAALELQLANQRSQIEGQETRLKRLEARQVDLGGQDAPPMP